MSCWNLNRAVDAKTSNLFESFPGWLRIHVTWKLGCASSSNFLMKTRMSFTPDLPHRRHENLQQLQAQTSSTDIMKIPGLSRGAKQVAEDKGSSPMTWKLMCASLPQRQHEMVRRVSCSNFFQKQQEQFVEFTVSSLMWVRTNIRLSRGAQLQVAQQQQHQQQHRQ